MKILQIIYSLSSGGAERFVVDLCNRLSEKREDEILLLTICDSHIPRYAHYLQDLDEKVRFCNFHLKKGLSIKSVLETYRFIRNERPDIVHLHSNMLLCFLSFLLCKKPQYIHTLHNLAEKCLYSNWQKFANNYFYRRNVHAVAISEVCLNSFHYLYPGTSVCKINNGREQMKTDDYNAVLQYIEKLKKGKSQPVFIHVARNAPQKNQQLLFNVFERLFNNNVCFQLLVIGANHEENAIKYDGHPQIHILGERNNIADYLICADYFVLSSLYEGLPLSLLEAMSMGCIPICTPAGGIVDVIQNGVNGFISSGFSEESYYNCVLDAISGSHFISKEKVKADYKNNYSMEICASNYCNLYHILMERKRLF